MTKDNQMVGDDGKTSAKPRELKKKTKATTPIVNKTSAANSIADKKPKKDTSGESKKPAAKKAKKPTKPAPKAPKKDTSKPQAPEDAKGSSTPKKTKKPGKVAKKTKPAAKKTKKPGKAAKKTKPDVKKTPKKITKAEQKRLAKEAEEAKKAAERTFEEELEEQLTDEEIENFRIEKVDMEKLINRVSEIIATFELNGIIQNKLWKMLSISNRDGSRLALKLERMGIITREKVLANDRWTYRLIIKKTPISTRSIEGAPCLVCRVEQKCTIDGEISPKNCQLIEDWVILETKRPKKA